MLSFNKGRHEQNYDPSKPMTRETFNPIGLNGFNGQKLSNMTKTADLGVKHSHLSVITAKLCMSYAQFCGDPHWPLSKGMQIAKRAIGFFVLMGFKGWRGGLQDCKKFQKTF